MKKKLFFSVCLSLPLALFPLSAPAEEGSPLLSVDVLIALEDSYEAFLNKLGDLAVQRGLLSEEDRAAWHDAQLGDYFQNGGYGSILISYMPGALSYTREEDTLLSLSAAFDGGRLELMTMRRYTPGDSTLSGLMLTPTAYIAVGISGQMQHMVGCNRSGAIFAINKDKNAPIFKQCDFGLVGDIKDVLPAITAAL